MKLNTLQLFFSLFLLLGVCQTQLSAQSFSTYSTTMVGFAQGSSDWGDYDEDGYLDVIFTGILANSQASTKLYRNTQGAFEEVSAGIADLKNGTVKFGDYDNDNDLDILICGLNNNYEATTLLYQNQNGAFVKMNMGFPGIYNGGAFFGDFDNDGFLDVLLTGDTLSYTPMTRLYKNNGDGSFSVVSQDFYPLISSTAAFGDYDNDGDNDILICGDYSGMYVSKIYRNDNGIFAPTSIFLEGLGAGAAEFLDFDKDNDNDLLMLGNDMTLTPAFKVYRNDGPGIYTEVNEGITGLALGNLAIADYNNDGYPDFAATGKAAGCGATASFMYFNNKQGGFWQEAVSLQNMSNSHVSWGDMDNDSDPDLLLMGIGSNGYAQTVLYRNNSGSNAFTPWQAPSAPNGMQATVDGNNVTLTWDKSLLGKAAQTQFSYNLRVGINPGKMEVMSPNASLATGFCKLPGMGNVGCDTSWTITNLREGDYFWSVQAVDHAFGTSAFTEEGTFTISLTGVNDLGVQAQPAYPNPFVNSLSLHLPKTRGFSKVQMTNLQGSVVYKTLTDQSTYTIPTANLASGLYIVRIEDINGKATFYKVCKE
jgi:hypothetical protein